MNKHEIFNTVADHLLKQGRRAMKDGYCAYRGDDGTKCAVGCLIPDDVYDPTMEKQSASWLLHTYPKFRSVLFGDVHMHDLKPDQREVCRLMAVLQGIHDDDWNKVVPGLRSASVEFKINVREDLHGPLGL